jgi:hypothetical protein
VATPIVYPGTLPIPQTSQVRGKERRQLSNREYPAGVATAIERDRIEYEQVSWPPMTQAKAAELRAWWKASLFDGAAWFAATWPLPRGFESAVRKFTAPLYWEFVPGGLWRVSGETEVRGRGMDPQAYGGCDCSHTAWLSGFEQPGAGDPPGIWMENGGAEVTIGSIVTTGADPLYGAGSLDVSQGDELLVTFDSPEIPVPGPWSLGFSVRPQEVVPSTSGYGRIRVYNADPEFPSEVARITWENNYDGTFKFNWFFVVTFSSGEQGGYAWGETHDVEMNFGEGRFRVFVNGELVFSEGTGSEPLGVGYMELLSVDPEELSFELDEFRLTNQVEHTEAYTPSLPFCRC